ncbi:hypothetical protein H1P_3410006 [Hyella patelloides LEGE 07179]|uniref:Uncharacterized protein n=1 Tax=Hyella patelloides LEGE 07179 TaxID=945734 RepID=A0A563VW93_9CYAN|nr:hypothetical protein [Hyella patelloides]VEP15523.1 hypothetical protein H1P_3410006 [Hyella patelloides LEGE 07179]
MSYELEQLNTSVVENELKYIDYQDRLVNWVLSGYQDETQFLPLKKLQDILEIIDRQVLENNENLFLIKSVLKIFKTKLNLNSEQEQNLSVIMLDFVEKVQKKQIKKIKNPHAVAGQLLLLAQGKTKVINTILRTILQNETFITSNYVKNLTLWLASEQRDKSQLLTGKDLELALINSHSRLTEIENKFLVRSLVFNLRG